MLKRHVSLTNHLSQSRDLLVASSGKRELAKQAPELDGSFHAKQGGYGLAIARINRGAIRRWLKLTGKCPKLQLVDLHDDR